MRLKGGRGKDAGAAPFSPAVRVGGRKGEFWERMLSEDEPAEKKISPSFVAGKRLPEKDLAKVCKALEDSKFPSKMVNAVWWLENLGALHPLDAGEVIISLCSRKDIVETYEFGVAAREVVGKIEDSAEACGVLTVLGLHHKTQRLAAGIFVENREKYKPRHTHGVIYNNAHLARYIPTLPKSWQVDALLSAILRNEKEIVGEAARIASALPGKAREKLLGKVYSMKFIMMEGSGYAVERALKLLEIADENSRARLMAKAIDTNLKNYKDIAGSFWKAIESVPEKSRHALRLKMLEMMGSEFPELEECLGALEPRERGRLVAEMLKGTDEKVAEAYVQFLESVDYVVLKRIMPAALRSKNAKIFKKAREIFINYDEKLRDGLCDYTAEEVLEALGKEWTDIPGLWNSTIGIGKDKKRDEETRVLVENTMKKFVALHLAPYLKESVRRRVEHCVCDVMEEFFSESEMTIKSQAGMELFRLIALQPESRREKLYELGSARVAKLLGKDEISSLRMVEAIQYLPEKYRPKLYRLGKKCFEGRHGFGRNGWDLDRSDNLIEIASRLPREIQVEIAGLAMVKCWELDTGERFNRAMPGVLEEDEAKRRERRG